MTRPSSVPPQTSTIINTVSVLDDTTRLTTQTSYQTHHDDDDDDDDVHTTAVASPRLMSPREATDGITFFSLEN